MATLSVLEFDDPHGAHLVLAALRALKDRFIITVHDGQTGEKAAVESNWKTCPMMGRG
jgi:uncharacterized membrane protein